MGAGASTLTPNVKKSLLGEFTKKRPYIDAKLAENTGDAEVAKFLTDFAADMVKFALTSAQIPPSGKIVHKSID